MERLVEEGLLTRRKGRLFEVQSSREADLNSIKDKCAGPLASIAPFYETAWSGEYPAERTASILQALEEYSHGRNYSIGEACEQLVSHDEFGDPMFRWGYRVLSETTPSYADINLGETTPVHRRKISISRMLINVDSSPSVSIATSVGGSDHRFRSDLGYQTGCSAGDSTATAD